MKNDDELKALIKKKIDIQKWDDEDFAALIRDIFDQELDDSFLARLKIKDEDLN